jgi:hypothetical protein
LPKWGKTRAISFCLHEIYRIPREENCTAKQVAKMGFILGFMLECMLYFVDDDKNDTDVEEMNKYLVSFLPFGFTMDHYVNLKTETHSQTCTCCGK